MTKIMSPGPDLARGSKLTMAGYSAVVTAFTSV
jgi:hypothetical protein